MSHKMIQLTINDELQSQGTTQEKILLPSKSQFNDVWYSRKETTQEINKVDRLNQIVSLKNSSREAEEIHSKGNLIKNYSSIRLGIQENIVSSGLENETAQDQEPDNPSIVEKRRAGCMTCCHCMQEKRAGDFLVPESYSCAALLDTQAEVSGKARVPLASELKVTNTIVIAPSNRDEFKTKFKKSLRGESEICIVRNNKKILWVEPMSSSQLPESIVNKLKVKPKITDAVLHTCFLSKEYESLDTSSAGAKISFKDRTRDILFERSISYECLRKETMQEIYFSSDAITPGERDKFLAMTSGDINAEDDVVSAPLLPTILDDPLVSEFWRLTTFRDAVDVPVFVQRLAQSGFYYDAHCNDIRCFSCGVSKRHWQYGERPALVHLHLSPECPQANSSDSRNIPITSMYQPRMTCQTGTDPKTSVDQPHLTGHHRDNLVTSMQNPTLTKNDPNISSTDSNSSSSKTLCSQNTGSASVTRSAEVAPRSLSANPRKVPSISDATKVTTQLYPASLSREEERTDGDQTREEEQDHRIELVASDSCLPRPALANPSDVNFSQRLLTFGSWSNSTASPTELAEAGFSYLGTGDSVRCFSCALTLKSWTGDLTPWVAHVVYRSSCDYVLSVKGEDFVRTTLVTFGRARRKEDGNSPRSQTHEATYGVVRVSDTGEATVTVSKVQALAAAGDVSWDSGLFPSDSRPAMTYTRIPLDAEAGRLRELADSSRHLRESLTCRQCRHREVDTLLLPCGHLCACSSCASDITQCLVCLQAVMATVLVHRE